MTYAGAGAIPARPFFQILPANRSLAFAGAGLLAALNAQAGQIIDAIRFTPLIDSVTSLAGISAVVWAAMYAVLRIALEEGSEPYRRADGLVLAAVLAASFVPLSFAAQAGLLLCGLYLFATSRTTSSSGRAAIVLLALTGPLLWGRIILHSFEVPLLALDARLVGSAISSTVDGNTLHFAESSRRFLIGGPCSSVHNMSLAILLWTTAAALFKLRIDVRLLAFGVAMVALMFALNIARLASIGLFPADFELLHNGAGAVLFGWAGLIGAGALAGLGVSDAVRRQH
ncbi:MAG: hypothetical protein ABR588_01845 [Sphingomicrobium sp.]|nr:exosortase/archaeosortase family protein [Sphingomonadales bacterium]